MRSRSKARPERRSPRRRPSAALAVALIALFVSLAGTGWAAFGLAANTVGTTQLRDRAVTNRKLANRAVGKRQLAAAAVTRASIRRAAVGAAQVDAGQVQPRLTGSCAAASALGSVGLSGTVACNPTLPQSHDRGSSTIRVTAAHQPIAFKPLTGGSSFLVVAYPEVTVKGSVPGQSVEVACSLGSSQAGGLTRAGALRFEIGRHARTQAATIPLVLAVPGTAGGPTVEVRCGDSFAPSTAAPKVSVKTTIDAVQT
jgi:hypothetical protein